MKTKSFLLTAGLLALLAVLLPARAADTILHNFTGSASDGGNPYDSLTLSGSTLYGMTYQGGSSNGGALFSMNSDGTGFGLLHSFTGGASDGAFPFGSLTLSGSTLYGLTLIGGSSNGGVLFSMNSDGTGFGLLHSFTGSASDGAIPYGSLTLSGTKLYGMTYNGGSSGNGGSGALFSMNTDGTGFSLLHTFTGSASDGSSPFGSLTLSGTKFYGTTAGGGSNNTGTIFIMNTDGTGFSLLHSFDGSASDGGSPYGSLMLSGSTLYGMTRYGGSSGTGALFSIGTDGTGFDLLESFSGAPADGAYPRFGDVTLSGDGSTLFGMTYAGGTANAGVVFSRSLVAPEPASAALLGLGALLLAARRRRVTKLP